MFQRFPSLANRCAAQALGFCALVVVLPSGGTAQTLGLGMPRHPAFPIPSAAEFCSRRNLEFATIGTAATLLAFQHDNPDRMETALERAPGEAGSDWGNLYGNGLFLGASTAALWTAGRWTGNANTMGAAQDLGTALALNGAVVLALKASIRRTRPNGGSYSFPSGHTSSAFTVAPILTKRFGWKVGAPAYAFAVMTGMGRMEDRQHFASDVLAGATLGLVVGETFAHRGGNSRLPQHFYMGKRGLGLRFGF